MCDFNLNISKIFLANIYIYFYNIREIYFHENIQHIFHYFNLQWPWYAIIAMYSNILKKHFIILFQSPCTLATWCVAPGDRKCSPHLHAHHDQQAGLRQQSEGLIVGDVFAVVSHCVVHGGPRDEEEDEGAVAAVQHAAHKHLLTEVQVELARSVELRVLGAPAVVHILHKHSISERGQILMTHIIFNKRKCLIWVIPNWFINNSPLSAYLVKEAHAEDRKRRVHHVIQGDEPLVIHCLWPPTTCKYSVNNIMYSC